MHVLAFCSVFLGSLQPSLWGSMGRMGGHAPQDHFTLLPSLWSRTKPFWLIHVHPSNLSSDVVLWLPLVCPRPRLQTGWRHEQGLKVELKTSWEGPLCEEPPRERFALSTGVPTAAPGQARKTVGRKGRQGPHARIPGEPPAGLWAGPVCSPVSLCHCPAHLSCRTVSRISVQPRISHPRSSRCPCLHACHLL